MISRVVVAETLSLLKNPVLRLPGLRAGLAAGGTELRVGTPGVSLATPLEVMAGVMGS